MSFRTFLLAPVVITTLTLAFGARADDAPIGPAPAPSGAVAATSDRTTSGEGSGGDSGGDAEADEDSRTLLERAEHAYGMLECESALATADALAARGGLSHDTLVRLARVLTLANAALDRDGAARDAAVRLFAYDPTFRIDPQLSPKLRTPVLEARLFWRDQTVVPGLDASVKASATRPSTMTILLRDPLQFVARVEVRYRWGQEGSFVSVPGKNVAASSVTLPTPPPGELRLDYFVRAFDAKDNVVLERGDEANPRSAVAPPPSVVGPSRVVEGRSVFKSPIFWAVAGAVVASASTGLYLATRPADVSVTPTTSMRLSGGLGCGGQKCN